MWAPVAVELERDHDINIGICRGFNLPTAGGGGGGGGEERVSLKPQLSSELAEKGFLDFQKRPEIMLM